MNTSKWTARDMAEIALVAAIYVALTLTPPLNAISFGAVQFRLSEMLNFLAFYNRKYIIAVTIGCMISNLIGFGVIDLFVGGFSTLIFVTLGVILFENTRRTIYSVDYLTRLSFISHSFCGNYVYHCFRIKSLIRFTILSNLVDNSSRRIAFSISWSCCYR